MAIATNRCLFLHIPKTAGTFVKTVLESVDTVQVVGQDIHTHFPTIVDPQNRPIFCFVRHPVSWYFSRYAFRLQNGWVGAHPLDSKCASNSFDQFIDNVCEAYPAGWITKEYSMFIDSAPTAPIIGRVENLYDDLYHILTGFKYRMSRRKMEKLGFINSSRFGKLRPRDVIKINDDTIAKIIKLEHKVVDRFYANYDSLPLQ